MTIRVHAAASGLYVVRSNGREIAKINNRNMSGRWFLYAVDQCGTKIGDRDLDVTHVLHHTEKLNEAISAFLAE